MSRKSIEPIAGESIEWIVRPMCHDDIVRCLEIWRQVELTEAYQTVASSLTTDPNGFHVAELVPDGLVVGMCAGPMTRDDTAFMGFYAVDPDYQGIGIGRELWARTMARFDESVNVGLYGVPAMADKYKKSGFKLEDSMRMLIYESNPEDGDNLDLNQLKDLESLDNCAIEMLDWQTSEHLVSKLIEYDEQVHTFSREKLLKNYLTGHDIPLTLVLIRQTPNSGRNANGPIDSSRPLSEICQPRQQQHHEIIQGRNHGDRKSSCCAKPGQESIMEDETLSTTIRSSLSISVNNIRELQTRSTSPIDIPTISTHRTKVSPSSDHNDLEIIGYGCIRTDNTSGGMIGPLYADSDEICEVILKNLLVRYKLQAGSKYSVMSLSSNRRASTILKKIGLTEMDQCSRMFTKFIPTAILPKIYYVHSPNFSLF